MLREVGGAVYFEAAGVFVTLVLLGQGLELKARGRTSTAIKALFGLAPKTARRIRNSGTSSGSPSLLIQIKKPKLRHYPPPLSLPRQVKRYPVSAANLRSACLCPKQLQAGVRVAV